MTVLKPQRIIVEDVQERTILPDNMADLGAPDGWTWRTQQRELGQQILDSDKKIIILQAEPGVGKTAIAWAITKADKGKSCVLVQTRQLERQYLNDFKDMRMIEGRRHYTCNISGRPAVDAPCTVSVPCQLKGKKNFEKVWTRVPECNYYLAKMHAERAKASVHNYSYWLNETRYNWEFTSFRNNRWIVCDEAHDLQTILMEFEVIELSRRHISHLGFLSPDTESIRHVQQWAFEIKYEALELHSEKVDKGRNLGLRIPYYGDEPEPSLGIDEEFEITEEMREIIKEIQALSNFLDDLNGITAIPENELDEDAPEWILDTTTDNDKISIRPLYGKRGIRRIMRATEKILMMSAYLAPELLIENLGLDPDECEVIEANEVFDRSKSPFLFCPTIKMSFRTEDNQWRRIAQLLDLMTEYYSPRSGMIHVPSVRLRDTLLKHSKRSHQYITYDGDSAGYRRVGSLNKDGALALFQRVGAEKQRILLGQSIATGVDIPYVPGWNVIVKMPFPPTTDPAIKARMEQDKLFMPYLTICTLVQAAGRSKRADDHHCQTIILDRQFQWFHAAYRSHFPRWFERNLFMGGWDALNNVRKEMKKKGIRF
jgi:Rad3-related DNA helicase